MKWFPSIIPVLIIVGLVATAAAEQQPVERAAAKPAAPKGAARVTLPPAVDAAFKKAYPDATIRDVSKEGKEYEIESLDSGVARDLNYRADGTLVHYEEQVAEAAVPPAVIAAVKTKYPKATIARCEKFFKDGTMNYEIELKGAKADEVLVSAEGKFVSPK
jgi:hypothetical protein